MIYSHSRLSTYEQCPLKFKFKYIDKIRTETEQTIEAFLGSMVHETLEWLYKNVMMTKVPTLKETLAHYKTIWNQNYNDQIKILHDEFSPKHYFKKGQNFIEMYYNGYKPFNENTISMEQKITIDLDGTGKYKLVGYIDRLVYNKDEGIYEVHDYKTNSTLKTQAELDHDRQLALYSIAIKDMYPDANKVHLIWHFLAFDKEFYSYRTDEQLEKLKKDTIKLIQKIESTKHFRAKETNLCNWCEFKQLCPRFKHLFSIKQKDSNEYLKDAGVKLVNKYAELNQKKKELTREIDREMDLLKEAIIKYAKKKGIDVIFGSNNKVSIRFTKIFKPPRKNTEEREELENMLKKLKKWDEISTLDSFALNRIIIDEQWPKEILNKVKKFGKIEETPRISLSKRRDVEK